MQKAVSTLFCDANISRIAVVLVVVNLYYTDFLCRRLLQDFFGIYCFN